MRAIDHVSKALGILRRSRSRDAWLVSLQPVDSDEVVTVRAEGIDEDDAGTNAMAQLRDQYGDGLTVVNVSIEGTMDAAAKHNKDAGNYSPLQEEEDVLVVNEPRVGQTINTAVGFKAKVLSVKPAPRGPGYLARVRYIVGDVFNENDHPRNAGKFSSSGGAGGGSSGEKFSFTDPNTPLFGPEYQKKKKAAAEAMANLRKFFPDKESK